MLHIVEKMNRHTRLVLPESVAEELGLPRKTTAGEVVKALTKDDDQDNTYQEDTLTEF